jgi:hypothetical protein
MSRIVKLNLLNWHIFLKYMIFACIFNKACNFSLCHAISEFNPHITYTRIFLAFMPQLELIKKHNSKQKCDSNAILSTSIWLHTYSMILQSIYKSKCIVTGCQSHASDDVKLRPDSKRYWGIFKQLLKIRHLEIFQYWRQFQTSDLLVWIWVTIHKNVCYLQSANKAPLLNIQHKILFPYYVAFCRPISCSLHFSRGIRCLLLKRSRSLFQE